PTGYKFDPVVLNTKLPLEFFEARNALRIAQSEGAENYANDTYQHAVRLMNQVDEDAIDKHSNRKAMIGVAREAVQTAEDARAITVKKIEQERLDNERQAAANAQADTQAQADEAIRPKERAEHDQARAEFAKDRAESDTAKAQAARAQAESDTARAQADFARAQSDMASSQAASADALSAAQADADQSRLAAQRAQANS